MHSGLVVMALNCHARDRRFENRFGLEFSGVPPVHPAVTGTCIAAS